MELKQALAVVLGELIEIQKQLKATPEEKRSNDDINLINELENAANSVCDGIEFYTTFASVKEVEI